MEDRKITREEQSCIAGCIQTHWKEQERDDAPEMRDEKYEECLEGCKICG